MVEALYSNYMPKGSKPFIFLNLTMSPQRLDVNVSPTKHKVIFANTEEIIKFLQENFDKSLASFSGSKIFNSQTLPQSVPKKIISEPKKNSDSDLMDTSNIQSSIQEKKQNIYPHQMIRTDYRSQTLDYCVPGKKVLEDSFHVNIAQPKQKQDTQPILSSVLKLLSEIKSEHDMDLSKAFQTHIFVGIIDNTFCLLQFDTKLFLVNIPAVTRRLMYQLVLDKFSRFSYFKIDPPLSLKQLLNFAYHDSANITTLSIEEAMTKIEIWKPMLSEYFAITMEGDYIQSFPILINGYIPDLAELPQFFYNLCVKIDWSGESEEETFFGIAMQLADFQKFASCVDELETLHKLILPSLRNWKPSHALRSDSSLTIITSMEKLYKKFERC